MSLHRTLSNTMRPYLKYLGITAAYWLLFFSFFRLILLLLNMGKAHESGWGTVAQSFVVGLRFDASLTGYLMLLWIVLLLLLGWRFALPRLIPVLNGLAALITFVLSGFLIANGFLYQVWGYHFDAASLHFLEDPHLVVASVPVWQLVVLPLMVLIVAGAWQYAGYSVLKKAIGKAHETLGWPWMVLRSFLLLLFGAILIVPIRGGTGIAPLNTGMAYFSNQMFANHLALNPVWNFIYSTKRLSATSAVYHFMPDEQAETAFKDLMAETGHFPRVLHTTRPNIIVVLLESFSAQTIEALGGVNATPAIKSILPESILFSNMIASSDRSGKGLISVMAGYPVLPSFSIIQYPRKTQTLSFIPKELKKAGYQNLGFFYGGDLNFNNFNTIAQLGDFDHIVTEDDFSESQKGLKWGAHDEFVFDRLLDDMATQPEPFFNFLFTLSSHEPFVVPMKKQFDDPYLNSVCYTDRCLGIFIEKAKKEAWWSRTLLILIADHGHQGPMKAGLDQKERFHVPMIWTGGALAVRDTAIAKLASQNDLARTLLKQLDIETGEFPFSKNILDGGNQGFSFFDFSDGFGFIRGNHFQVYDNQAQRFVRFEGAASAVDSVAGKAFLQMMSNDNQKR